MLRCWAGYLTALLGLALFYIYCSSYIPFVMILLLLFFTLVGIFVTWLSRKSVSIEVKPTHKITTKQKDREAEFCVTVKNKSYFPMSAVTFTAVFRDPTDSGSVKRKIKTPAAINEEISIHTMVTTSHCSVVECSIESAKVYDPFGLFRFKIITPNAPASMVLMPTFADESYINNKSEIEIVDSDRYSDTQKGSDSSQVFEVREYVPGDDIRRIHWRLSSKLDSLIVKEYSKPISENCVILLETGIGSENSRLRKFRTDCLLPVFMKLMYELLENEHKFDVCWYSENEKSLMMFEVKTYDDAAPLIKSFLSEKTTSDRNAALKECREQPEVFLEKQIYYLYNSEASNDDIINELDDRFFVIDTYREFEEE